MELVVNKNTSVGYYGVLELHDSFVLVKKARWLSSTAVAELDEDKLRNLSEYVDEFGIAIERDVRIPWSNVLHVIS